MFAGHVKKMVLFHKLVHFDIIVYSRLSVSGEDRESGQAMSGPRASLD